MQLAIWVSQDLSAGSKLPDSIWCPSVTVPGEWTEPHLPELLIEAEASVTVTVSRRFPFWEGDYAVQIWGGGERTQAWNALREGLPGQSTRDLRRQWCRDPVLLGVRPGWARGEGRPHTISCQLSCFAPSSSSRAQGTSKLGPALPCTTHHAPSTRPPSICTSACVLSPAARALQCQLVS